MIIHRPEANRAGISILVHGLVITGERLDRVHPEKNQC
jgi:hypothetical protein